MTRQASDRVIEQFDDGPWAEIGIRLRKLFHDQLLKQTTRLVRFRLRDLVWLPGGERLRSTVWEQARDDYRGQ
jgi:hypothetical protein